MMFLYLLLRVLDARSKLCKSGRDIESEVITDITKAVGEWSLVYDWDSLTVYEEKFLHIDHSFCPKFRITEATSEDIENFKADCGYADPNFAWDKAKIKISSPEVVQYDRLVAGNETGNFVLERCSVSPIVLRKVNARQLLVVYPNVANVTLLLSKSVPEVEELKCLNDNLDAVKTLNGVSLCYK